MKIEEEARKIVVAIFLEVSKQSAKKTNTL